jgi:hypothetical protein
MIALPLLTRRRCCVTSGYQMLPLKLPVKSLKYNSVTCVTSIFLIREKFEEKVNDCVLIMTTKTSAACISEPTCKKQVTQVTHNQISELAGNAKGNIKVTGGDTSYACDQPNKISAVPLVNPKSLQDVFASRVPALGCGWENLVIFADSVRCITIFHQLLDTA